MQTSNKPTNLRVVVDVQTVNDSIAVWRGHKIIISTVISCNLLKNLGKDTVFQMRFTIPTTIRFQMLSKAVPFFP